MDSRIIIVDMPSITQTVTMGKLVPIGIRVTYRRRSGSKKSLLYTFNIAVAALKQVLSSCFKKQIDEPFIHLIDIKAQPSLTKSELVMFIDQLGQYMSSKLGYTVPVDNDDFEHSFILELLYHRQGSNDVETRLMKRLFTDNEKKAILTRFQLTHAQYNTGASQLSLPLEDRDNS